MSDDKGNKMSRLPGSSPLQRSKKNVIAERFLPRGSSMRSITDTGSGIEAPPLTLLTPQPRKRRVVTGSRRRSSLGAYSTGGFAQLSNSDRRADIVDPPPLMNPLQTRSRRKGSRRRSSLGSLSTGGSTQVSMSETQLSTSESPRSQFSNSGPQLSNSESQLSNSSSQLSNSERRSRSPPAPRPLRRTSSLETPRRHRHAEYTPIAVQDFLKSSQKIRSSKLSKMKEKESSSRPKSSSRRNDEDPRTKLSRKENLKSSSNKQPTKSRSHSSSAERVSRALERRERYRLSTGSDINDAKATAKAAAMATQQQTVQQELQPASPSKPLPGSIVWLKEEISKLPLPGFTAYQQAWRECLAAFGQVAVALYGLLHLTFQPVVLLLWLLLQVPRYWLLPTSVTSWSTRRYLTESPVSSGSGRLAAENHPTPTQ